MKTGGPFSTGIGENQSLGLKFLNWLCANSKMLSLKSDFSVIPKGNETPLMKT